MNKISKIHTLAAAALTITAFTSCDDNMGSNEVAHEPYLLAMGITSSGTTTYYTVTANDLMNGTISAVGKGIEQNGYRDYQQASQTVFSIGGLGVTEAVGIQRDADGFIQENGHFQFNNTPIGFCQVDDDHMAALELPVAAGTDQSITFYSVGIKSLALENKATTPIAPIDQMEWPSVTGMVYSAGNLYVSYVPMSTTTFATPSTDTSYVAVYSYPDFRFRTLIKDTRFGNIGSWNAFNGFQKDENGNVYAMSNSSLANGFSQSNKNSGFLRIKAGDTTFDKDYTFDYEAITGQKVAHWQYLGNGKVFAEVTTHLDASRWSDADLKCCIIDLVNKTSTDVEGIPVHNGQGGRRFVALHEGEFVYAPIATSDGVYIYRTNISTGRAERGARVAATFVGGLFRLK